MSLTNCLECGHEMSADAAACPSCGRPTQPTPVVHKTVILPTPVRKSEFPTWAFIPIGLLAAVLLFVVYLAFRQTDETANTNVNVNVAGRRTTTVPSSETRTTSVPSDPTSVSVPNQPPPQTTTVPGTTTSAPVPPPPDKGTVVINAKIAPPRGSVQSARNTKFYLLDEDLETILSKARIEPIEGNSLSGSLGLAAVYPDRYGEFQRAAMRAIAAHAKYSGTTSSGGTANLSNIAPDSYYLFAITRVGSGFALWSAPVSIVAGENVLNLSPQSVTEIPKADG